MGAVADGISHFHEQRIAPSGIVLGRGVSDFLAHCGGRGVGWAVPVAEMYGLPVSEDNSIDTLMPSMFGYLSSDESYLHVVAEGSGFVRAGMCVSNAPASLRYNVDIRSHNGRWRRVSETYSVFRYESIVRAFEKTRAPTPRELWS